MSSDPTQRLRARLLGLGEAAAISPHGATDAAVLVPIYNWPGDPGLIFTERRQNLRRHAGEVSFPGGRCDPGESYVETALRETWEEIGLASSSVEVIGALEPIGTIVTGYAVHPIVGLVSDLAQMQPNPDEVETVLAFGIDRLVAGFEMRRVARARIPVKLPTYTVDGHMIWGATGRILGDLLARLGAPAGAPSRRDSS